MLRCIVDRLKSVSGWCLTLCTDCSFDMSPFVEQDNDVMEVAMQVLSSRPILTTSELKAQALLAYDQNFNMLDQEFADQYIQFDHVLVQDFINQCDETTNCYVLEQENSICWFILRNDFVPFSTRPHEVVSYDELDLMIQSIDMDYVIIDNDFNMTNASTRQTVVLTSKSFVIKVNDKDVSIKVNKLSNALFHYEFVIQVGHRVMPVVVHNPHVETVLRLVINHLVA